MEENENENKKGLPGKSVDVRKKDWVQDKKSCWSQQEQTRSPTYQDFGQQRRGRPALYLAPSCGHQYRETSLHYAVVVHRDAVALDNVLVGFVDGDGTGKQPPLPFSVPSLFAVAMLPKLPSQVIHRRHVSNGGGKEVDGKTTKGLVQGHVAPGRRGVFDTFSVPR